MDARCDLMAAVSVTVIVKGTLRSVLVDASE
jgi:hypothetical protein